MKRVLREVFRTANFCLPGWQIVVVAKKGAQILGYAQAASEVTVALSRLVSLASRNG